MSFELWANHYTSLALAEAQKFEACCTRIQESFLVQYDRQHSWLFGLTLEHLNPEALTRHDRRLKAFDHCFGKMMDSLERIRNISHKYLFTVKASLQRDRTNTIARWLVCDDFRNHCNFLIGRELKFILEHRTCFGYNSAKARERTVTFALDYFLTMGDKSDEELAISVDYSEILECIEKAEFSIFQCLDYAARHTKTASKYYALHDRIKKSTSGEEKVALQTEFLAIKQPYSDLRSLAAYLAENVFAGFKKIPKEITTLRDFYVHVIKPMQKALGIIFREELHEHRGGPHWYESFEEDLISAMLKELKD